MNEEVKRIAKDLESLVNSFTYEPQIVELVDTLSITHRTLQQSLTRLFFLWIKQMATKYVNNAYDARNEESVKRCFEITQMWGQQAEKGELVLDNLGIPYLPMI